MSSSTTSVFENKNIWCFYHNNEFVLDRINTVGMDDTYKTDADDEYFHIQDYDDNDHNTDGDTDEDTDAVPACGLDCAAVLACLWEGRGAQGRFGEKFVRIC